MFWALLQAIACAAGGVSCGGGGGGASDGAAGVAAAPAPAPAAATRSAATAPAATEPTPAVPAPAAGIALSFTLPAARTTSAGVYDATGTLVRTLWRGERLPAGSHTRQWDQRADDGSELTGTSYTVKLVHHDLQYVWEGVVGNTSTRLGGALPHRSFMPPMSLAADGSHVHYAAGYNELQNQLHGFDAPDPQADRPAVPWTDPFIAITLIASDGRRLYAANAGGLAGRSFVVAFELATRQQAPFAAGQRLCLNTMDGTPTGTCYPAQHYAGVLEARADLASPPTGLAVQRQGTLLAVAYAADGEVRLYDKNSGALLRRLPVPLAPGSANQLAFAPGGDLWVLVAGGAQRWTALSAQPQLAAQVSGMSSPLAVAVDGTDDDSVWVADGGSSQQVRRYDRNGVLQATLGRAGGSVGTAAVSRDRLCFGFGPGHEQTALAVDAGRALWVVDTCNNRLLQFGRDGSSGQQVAWVPSSYAAAADPGNPTRVFSNYLEFAVDYSRPLSDPQAWTLVRNWLNVLPAEWRDTNSANWQWGGFRAVNTLANGRTYAQLAVGWRTVVAELKADGTMAAVRTLAASATGESNAVMYENGDIGWSRTAGGRQSVLRLPLQGFDAAGAPVWAAAPVELASVPAGPLTPHYRNGTFSGLLGPRFPVTEGGKVVFFDPSIVAGTGFHLGAAVLGGTAWAWQASPSGALDGLGTFQTRSTDNHLNYGGNVLMSSGRHLLYGYHGEGYTDAANGLVGQANQFMHFRDDGLFIGQFGTPSTRAVTPADAGLSGNAFSPTLLRHAGHLYLYHNDESTHGGVHRWRLDGADDIQELSATAAPRSAVVLR